MNSRLFVLAVGVGLGYVLGARAGRGPYEKLAAKADEVWTSPKVAKARREVEAYARQQAPIIRERAEAAAKAAPAFLADTAKDVAEKTSATAKTVATTTAATASKVATATADTAGKVAGKVTDVAGDVKDQVSKTAADVKDQVTKTADELRERGEGAVERAAVAAGRARDELLEDEPDDDSETGADAATKKD